MDRFSLNYLFLFSFNPTFSGWQWMPDTHFREFKARMTFFLKPGVWKVLRITKHHIKWVFFDLYQQGLADTVCKLAYENVWVWYRVLLWEYYWLIFFISSSLLEDKVDVEEVSPVSSIPTGIGGM